MATPIKPLTRSHASSSSSSSSAATAPADAIDDDKVSVWAAKPLGKQAGMTHGTKRDAKAAALCDVLVLKAKYGELDGVPAHSAYSQIVKERRNAAASSKVKTCYSSLARLPCVSQVPLPCKPVAPYLP